MPTLLLVDDNEVLTRLTALLLVESLPALVVDRAATCEKARALFAARRPDVLLVDVNLPDGDGHALAADLRARHPSLRIVLTSADLLRADERNASPLLVDAWLPKPFESNDIVEAVQRALRGCGDAGSLTGSTADQRAGIPQPDSVTAALQLVDAIAADIERLLADMREGASATTRLSGAWVGRVDGIVARAFALSSFVKAAG